jgi:cell division septation protein DedD
MHRGFGGTAFEPVEERRDKELTLGPVMLTGLACALLVLCGVCFAIGYAVGHRGTSETVPAEQPATADVHTPQIASSQSKPAAGQNGNQSAPAVEAQTVAETDAGQAQGVSPAPAGGGSTTTASSPVQSALPAQAAATSPVPGGGGRVAAALPQTAPLMVQIAAVSNPDDAEVLVGALRRRGYAVTVRREPLDGLMHVQVGPFSNRNDALAMRQRLLNDGYNAIVQP